MTVTRRFRFTQKWRVATLLLALLVGVSGVVIGWHFTHQQTYPRAAALYHPTKAEDKMFSHFRHATPLERLGGSDALGDLQVDWHYPPIYDIYVAQSDFYTVYSPHPIVVMMRPGVKWLGGPLGNTTLVMRLTDQQLKSWTPAAWPAARNFAFANVVYDPFCRAYQLGSVTLAACQATPAQGQAAPIQGSLRPVTDAELAHYTVAAGLQVPEGPNQWAWYTPAGRSASLPPIPAGLLASGTPASVVLWPGQKLTGGVFGDWIVNVPSTQRLYRNDTDYDVDHIQIVDPLTTLCSTQDGVKSYLGPAVIKQYAAYCTS